MADEADHSEVLSSWSLVSRIEGKQEFLGDVSIEKLQWDLGGHIYRAVIESEEELKNLYEMLKKKFGDEAQSRDERVRKYWMSPESVRATYGVIKDSRGDILALEPHAVVGMIDSDRRPHIYTPRVLQDMGFYNLAEIVAGPDTPNRRLVAQWFMEYGMTPEKINARSQSETPEKTGVLEDEYHGNVIDQNFEAFPSGCIEE